LWINLSCIEKGKIYIDSRGIPQDRKSYPKAENEYLTKGCQHASTKREKNYMEKKTKPAWLLREQETKREKLQIT
jgi:hypothetical protein